MPLFAYVWEYRVHDDELERFQEVYGPGGDWVQLFEKAEGYVRTDLFRDADDPARFLTTDFWVSRNARDTFRRKFAEAFEKLDRECEALTVEERFVGDFDVLHTD